tara:strand:- start:1413 stop:1709 length:297 start_codon:yes stop_codon:yes gene_type:complete
MDKYIDRNPESNLGLDLLANNNKLRKNHENSDTLNIRYDTKLKDFKDIIRNRIDRFDPLKNSKDSYDNSIKLMWLEFITNSLTIEKQTEVYNMLGLEK